MTDAPATTFTPTSTHWGNYRVEHSGDNILGIHPYDIDKEPTPIADNMLAMLDPAVRIPQPMVRDSYLKDPHNSQPHLRGIDRYVPVSWDVALDLAADALRQARDKHGSQSIYGGSYGWGSAGRFHHAQSQIHRFLNMIGGYTASANTYSIAAAEVILPHIIGMNAFHVMGEAPTADDIAAHCKTVVLFGGAALKNSQVNASGLHAHSASAQLKQMRDAGVTFINISPIRSDTADFLNAEWVAARPGSDVALMLGMAHVLYTEGRHDAAFLERYCVGFDRFLPYLLGTEDGVPKDAAWASGLCGIDAERISQLTRKIAAGRSVIGLSWSLQRQEHGEQAYWMGTVLAAMLGHIGLAGGGVAYGYGCVHNVGFGGRRCSPFRCASVPQGENPTGSFIPVSRVTEMLEKPGGSFTYDGQTLTYPDVQLIYWAGGNPFHHHQDLNRMRKAWRKPHTVIINDPFWTGAARHADIVFPVATMLERQDWGADTDGANMSPMRQVVQPFAQARTDHQIFSGIAQRFGIEQAFTEGRSEIEWIEYLHEETRARAAEQGVTLPPFAEFWAGEQIYYGDQLPEVPFTLERFRSDPAANPLATPSGKIEIFSEVIGGFGYDDCPAHPVWLDKEEWLGAPRSTQFPLHMISNQPRLKLHSQLDHGPASRSAKIKGREPVRMTARDAAARGITDGDIVRIFNDRGACLAAAVISEDLSENVVELATGAWYWSMDPVEDKPLEVHGNPNVLTRDKGSSSLAQGPTAHSCLVEIELFDGPLPEVRAFTPMAEILSDPASEAR